MIMSVIEQIKTSEKQTEKMEAELAQMGKKYDKLMNKEYLDNLEETQDTQKAQIK